MIHGTMLHSQSFNNHISQRSFSNYKFGEMSQQAGCIQLDELVQQIVTDQQQTLLQAAAETAARVVEDVLNGRESRLIYHVLEELKKSSALHKLTLLTQNGVVENKDFWNTVKPFITNKSGKLKSDITIIHNEEIIRDEQKLVEIFNNEYINIVEKSSGIKPEPLGNFSYGDGYKIISEIENKYKNDASIIEIKNRIITDESQISFNFKEVSELDISKLFVELKTHVATGEDKIPAKLVKL